jgi:tRNA threonylcarbamoyladenosine biosynthesis protein TsaE
MSFKINITNIENLEYIAEYFKKIVEKTEKEIIFLKGDLGSGETTFVRIFVKKLKGSSHAEISSPSFNLYNIYPTFPEVIHIDLYRSIGLEEEILELLEMNAIIFIEWGEKLPLEYWPNEYILLHFFLKGEKRYLEIHVKRECDLSIQKYLKQKLKEHGLL